MKTTRPLLPALLLAALLTACATPREEGSTAPAVGDSAPALTLPIASGGEFDLARATRERAVVLVFYRGRF